MFTFFMLLLIGALLYPVVKGWLLMRAIRKRQEAFYQQFGGGRQQSAEPRPRKRQGKKITRDMGEYVEFEEIATFHTESDGTAERTSYREESQITDVTWEDINDK